MTRQLRPLDLGHRLQRNQPTIADFNGPIITNRDPMSQAAAESMEPWVATQRYTVWSLIRDSPDGLACWQVEQIADMLHQSASASINWLWKHKWLIRDGENRTPSNRRAHIYKAQRGD